MRFGERLLDLDWMPHGLSELKDDLDPRVMRTLLSPCSHIWFRSMRIGNLLPGEDAMALARVSVRVVTSFDGWSDSTNVTQSAWSNVVLPLQHDEYMKRSSAVVKQGAVVTDQRVSPRGRY